MKNRDELDGKTEQVKGRVKQAWGDLTNNEQLHDEGVADEAAGTSRKASGGRGARSASSSKTSAKTSRGSRRIR